MDTKFDFELYLGPYEKKHGWELRNAGYATRDDEEISFDARNTKPDMVVVQDDSIVKDEKMAISARNALLRVLK